MTAGPGARSSLAGALLDARFGAAAGWPVERASLCALIDIGLSDAQIATYFSVDPADVRALRDTYGLAGAAPG